MGKEEYIRVGTTLYKVVNQPRINGGHTKKRVVWNNETLRHGKSSVSCPLKPSDSTPLKHSTMPP